MKEVMIDGTGDIHISNLLTSYPPDFYSIDYYPDFIIVGQCHDKDVERMKRELKTLMIRRCKHEIKRLNELRRKLYEIS